MRARVTAMVANIHAVFDRLFKILRDAGPQVDTDDLVYHGPPGMWPDINWMCIGQIGFVHCG